MLKTNCIILCERALKVLIDKNKVFSRNLVKAFLESKMCQLPNILFDIFLLDGFFGYIRMKIFILEKSCKRLVFVFLLSLA